MAANGGTERGFQVGETEAVAQAERSTRLDALAGEEHAGHFAQDEAEGGGGDGCPGGAVEDAAEGAAEGGHRDRLRGGGVAV